MMLRVTSGFKVCRCGGVSVVTSAQVGPQEGQTAGLDSRLRGNDMLEAAGGSDVVEVAEVVVDADEVEHSTEAAEGDAHAVWSAKAAELTAAFDVWLEVEDDARDAALGELLLELRNRFGEVAKDAFVAAGADVGGNEVLEHFLVDVTG